MNRTIAKWTATTPSAILIPRDGPLGIGDPVAPRARIELGALQAGELHREQVVARGHARAAVVHHFGSGPALHDLLEFLLQLRRRLEGAVRADVLVAEAVPRAGNVARDPVDRLLLAAEALGGARIEKQRVVAL